MEYFFSLTLWLLGTGIPVPMSLPVKCCATDCSCSHCWAVTKVVCLIAVYHGIDCWARVLFFPFCGVSWDWLLGTGFVFPLFQKKCKLVSKQIKDLYTIFTSKSVVYSVTSFIWIKGIRSCARKDPMYCFSWLSPNSRVIRIVGSKYDIIMQYMQRKKRKSTLDTSISALIRVSFAHHPVTWSKTWRRPMNKIIMHCLKQIWLLNIQTKLYNWTVHSGYKYQCPNKGIFLPTTPITWS